jgi:hypothetical protein
MEMLYKVVFLDTNNNSLMIFKKSNVIVFCVFSDLRRDVFFSILLILVELLAKQYLNILSIQVPEFWKKSFESFHI